MATPARDRILAALESGPLFAREVCVAENVSHDSLRNLAIEGLVVNLYAGKKGRGNHGLWASVAQLERVLRERAAARTA